MGKLTFQKLLIRVLLFVLVLGTIPPKTFAISKTIPVEDADAKVIKTDPVENQNLKPGELIEERTANTKTFYNGNGKYTKKIYFEPIHMKEEGDKTFEEISPELTKDETESNVITTEKTAIDTEFLKTMSNGQYANFSYKGHSMSLSILQATGENKAPLEASDVNAQFVENTNKIVHKDVFPQIDLRNFTFNQNTKEDLILNEYNGYHIFKFKINTDLKAVKDENGNIQMKDEEDNMVFELPKPYMSDSNVNKDSGDAVTSDDIDYKIEETGGGYTLTLDANADWLASPDRVYPVYLDPSFSVTSSLDSFVMSAYPDTNYSSGKWDSALQEYVLKVGNVDATTGSCLAYLGLPIDKFVGLNITSATFNAYVTYAYSHSTPKGLWIGRNNAQWSPSTITYNNRPGSSTLTSVNVAENQWATFDVTSTLKSWLDGTNSNYGFILHTNGNDATYWKKIVSTSNNSTTDPYISVNYTIPVPELKDENLQTHYNTDGTAYFTLDWDKPSAGAKGYNVWIYNGTSYQSFNIPDGNTTTFSTQNKKIWPKDSQIDAGRKTLYTDGVSGQEFPTNPDKLYKATGGAYPTTKHYWFKISVKYADEIGESDMSNSLTPTVFEKPTAPTGRSFTNMVYEQSGYVNLNWKKYPDATGYKIYIYNGKSYESYDVGNVDNWTTQNKGIWPKTTEITGKTNVPLHHPLSPTDTNYGGTELPLDPSPLYRTYTTSYPNNKNYWFRVSAYDEHGESDYSATAYQPTIAPPVPFLGTEDYWTFVNVPGGIVNVGTGNYITSASDFSLDGRGSGIEVSRTYNSQSNDTGVFGSGWHSNLDSSIEADGNDLIYRDDDGTILRFSKDTSGNYVSPPGTYLTLKDNTSNYTLEDTSQTIITFDHTTKKITSITDDHNNKTTYNYSGGKLISIVDPSSRVVNISYKPIPNDNLIDKISYSTRTIQYNYDSGNMLSSVIDPEGNNTQYQYDTNFLLNKIVEPTDSLPIVTEIIYQVDSDIVDSVKDPKGYIYDLNYDQANKNLTVSFPNGKKNQYWYNADANPTKIIEDVGGLNITSTTKYVNNNLEEAVDPEDIGKSITQKYTYDSKGNIKTEDSHYGNESYVYNSDNNITSYKDTENKNYKTSYDSNKNPISSFDTTNATSSASVYNAYGDEIEGLGDLSASSNLLVNSSFENGTTGWTFPVSKQDSGTVTIDSIGAGGIGGNKSLKIDSKSTSTLPNDLGYLLASQNVNNIKEKSNYTVSTDVKTQINDGLFYIKVFFYDSAGTFISMLQNVSPVKGNQNWKTVPMTFTTPANTASITFKLEMNHYNPTSAGTAWIDNVQLEKSDVFSKYNPVQNGGFENSLTSWTGSGGANDSTELFDGSSSLKIARTSSTQATSEYKQTISIGQKITENPLKLTLTGLSKSTNVVANGANPNDYSLKAVLNYTDGTTSTVNANFLAGTNEWNRVYQAINPAKPINTIDLSVVYGGSFTGTAWFDGVRLIEDNRVTKTNYYADGNYVKEIVDPANFKTNYEYDNFGNISKVTDARSKIKSYLYDNNDLLKQLTWYGTTIDYKYNPIGLMKTKTISAADGTTETYQFDYDENGNLKQTTGPLNDITINEYDEKDNLKKTTLPSGNYISNTYDGSDRLKTISYNNVKYYDFGYDNNGNLKTVLDSQLNRSISKNLDDKNRVTDLTEIRQGVTSSQTWLYKQTSDKLDSTKFTQGPTTETTSYSYNDLDQNTNVSYSNKNFKSFYDELGNLSYYIAGNNATALYQYDNRNLLESLKVQFETGSTIIDETYQYDENGNRTNINTTNNHDIVYTYDEKNQLDTENYADGTLKDYNYDDFGNRTKVKVTKSGTTQSDIVGVFNKANQLTNYGSEVISYDLDGNRKQDGKYIYVWNPAGQLISVKKIGDSTPFVTYQYDEQGRRIQKTVNSVITKYYYEGNSINVLYETDSAGAVLRSYVYSANGQRLAMKTQGQMFYYSYNAHGDVIALTDDSKNVLATYTYDAWGNVISSTGSGLVTDNPFGYAGYMYDKEIKMYYLMARYYQPEQGVFLSVDPEPGDADDSITQNGYNYANNNPIMYFDFDGNAATSDGYSSGWASVSRGVTNEVSAGGGQGGGLSRLGEYFFGTEGKSGKGKRLNPKNSVKSIGKKVTYEQARNEALIWLKKRGFKANKQTLGKFGNIKNKPIGMKSNDGKMGFRIEYDDRNGAHINVWSGKEKGPHFNFDASEKTVKKIQKRFR